MSVAIDELINTLSSTTLESPATQESKRSERLEKRRRNWERMKDETIYLVSLSVKKGTTRKRIDVQLLNLPLNEILYQAVVDNESKLILSQGQQIIEVPTFPELGSYGSKLKSMRASVQKKNLYYAEPYWFCFGGKLEAVSQGFDEIQEKRDEFLAKLTDPAFYKGAKLAYLTRLSNILIASESLSKGQLSELLALYAEQFPNPDQIAESFCVIVDGPIQIPSLSEQVNSDAQLAEAMAKLDQANALEQETAARKKLSSQYIENLHQVLFEQVPQQVLNDAYGIVAEVMEDLERVHDKVSKGHSPQRVLEKLGSAFDELSTMIDFNQDLEALVDEVTQFKHIATSSVDADHFRQRLQNFKADVLGSLQIEESEGKGHKALADYIML